ncbi:hypothetical protein PIB30_070214 [Stylosanthes scabra]|uniref:Putative plant transposon protein domain-containing protein n=1 Tax=Stylosanthes scabra TaxID=79078 RepID=A0ABU6QPH0_9FABA|nr:hypothetical protein [Stylosanthes scabra]
MEQIALRGWRRLAAPRTDISKLLVLELYANVAVSDEEAAVQEELPYKSFVRGKEVDFSPNNIRRVMRFKRETAGAQTDYKTRQTLNQRLDEVLADLWIPGATWKLSSSQPPVPIQLRRTELQPLARGWQEFIIHSLVPTENKSEITTSRAILIDTIMQGEDVRAEEIIADNMCSREFIRTPRILALSYITAKRIETIRFPRNQPQQQEDEEEDEPMSQADGGNFEEEDQQPLQHGFPNFQPRYESQYHEDLQDIEETLSSMQFFQQTFYDIMQKSQADYMEEIWQEQEKLAKEIQEVQRSQLAQAEAYACWAQQQANPNLSEIPITQTPDIMRTNVEKGGPLFHGFLKSDYGASSSSQVDPEEPVPLQTAPPSPHFHPPHPPPN